MQASDLTDSRTQAIQEHLAPLRQQLLQHRVYGQLNTLADLAVFAEHHVYAVWDFMSLVKALQLRLTCLSLPWKPFGDPHVRRFINEIVLGEESDVDPQGRAASHYELYLLAMVQMGASTTSIQQLVNEAPPLERLPEWLKTQNLPSSVYQFLQFTFGQIRQAELHELAAVFTYGREDLIPELFRELVAERAEENPAALALFRYYLERHIELDGDEHGELAHQLLASLCGTDDTKWRQAQHAAERALQSRLQLWNGIAEALDASAAKRR